MTYIFLMSAPQRPAGVIASATHASTKPQITKIACSSTRSAKHHVLWKCFQSPAFNIYTKSKVRSLQVPWIDNRASLPALPTICGREHVTRCESVVAAVLRRSAQSWMTQNCVSRLLSLYRRVTFKKKK